jgi:hypothetical protein
MPEINCHATKTGFTDMPSVAGPDRISIETMEKIARELKALPEPDWVRVHAELHLDGKELVVFAVVPNEDPFEPQRLDRIFEAVENVIARHVPAEIPIRRTGESWAVTVVTESNDIIDGIMGGEGTPGRTDRLSDGLGPPSR